MRKLTTTQRIQDFLMANIGRGFKPAQVRDALSIGSYTTYTALKRMLNRRYISRTRGLYHVGVLPDEETLLKFAQALFDEYREAVRSFDGYVANHWIVRGEAVGLVTRT